MVSDAIRRVEHADIPSRFAVPFSKKNLLPLAPAVLVFGLTFFADKGRPTEAIATTTPRSAAQIHDSAEGLRKKLAQQRKEASEKGLQDVGDLIKKVEQGIKDLANKEGVDRKQAMVQLNDLSKQLEARRKELGDKNKLKQELGQMKDMKNGPAEKLADALKNGRFQKAPDELKKLQDSLRQRQTRSQRTGRDDKAARRHETGARQNGAETAADAARVEKANRAAQKLRSKRRRQPASKTTRPASATAAANGPTQANGPKARPVLRIDASSGKPGKAGKALVKWPSRSNRSSTSRRAGDARPVAR